MKKILILIGASVALTSCNTMSGVGKDVSTVGDTITEGSQKAKEAL